MIGASYPGPRGRLEEAAAAGGFGPEEARAKQ